MSKVSIILPTFNAENTINRCIESIINQTYNDWELICCDDSSDDKTYEKLLEWEKKDKRIRVFRNDNNMKAAYTRNFCIKKSTGKFIAQIDDDDFCDRNRILEQINFLRENVNYSFVGSDMYIFDNEGVYRETKMKEIPEKSDFLKGTCFSNPTVMFRKECLENVEGYRVAKETRRSQDYDLYMRLYAQGYRGYNIKKPLVYYYRGRNSYKKFKYIYRIDEMKIRYRNFKKLNLLPIGYVYAMKPIIVGLIPQKNIDFIKKVFNK